VYKAAVLSVLLFGCESWTLYCRHVRKLNQIHMRCIRQIAHIKWRDKDKIPNIEVLQRCKITRIEAFLLTAQLQWTRHVVRMDNSRLPMMIFYGGPVAARAALTRRTAKTVQGRAQGQSHHVRHYPAHLKSLTADRTCWRALCRQSIGSFEDSRVSHAENNRRLRKTGHDSISTSSTVQCDVCRRTCVSRIGLFSHKRTHL